MNKQTSQSPLVTDDRSLPRRSARNDGLLFRGLQTAAALGLSVLVNSTALCAQALSRQASQLSAQDELLPGFRQPPTQSRMKVRTGNAAPQTPDALRELARKGFGAAEVGIDFRDPSSKKNLAQALQAGKAVGLQVDLAPGGSQPFSAPGISEADSMQQLTTVPSAVLVSDGTLAYAGAVPHLPNEKLAASPTLRLVAVTAARTRGKSGGTVLLDPDSAVDLSSSIDATRTLHWQVPRGEWIVFAFWQRATGQIGAPYGPPFESPAALGAHVPAEPPGKFFIADVFSGKGISQSLDMFAANYLSSETRPLLQGAQLAYDSIELEADMFWTTDLPEEFRKRRGYAMTRYLPSLYRAKEASFDPLTPMWGAPALVPPYDFTGGVGDRVRYDYALTLNDLYVGRHLKAFNEKAHQLGLSSRVQVAYNYLQLNMTRSGVAVDTPENESLDSGWATPFDPTMPTYGTDRWRHMMDSYRLTGSGVHLHTGKRATLEFGDDFAAFRKQPADYVEQLNEGLAGGTTMGLLTDFAGVDAAWPAPGPLFAVGIGDAWTTGWPQWRDWPQLTEYFARSTVVLEAGKPQVDVAIYLDHGLSTAHQQTAPLFASDSLEMAGFTYDFIDPVTLSQAAATAQPGRLFGVGPSYRALILNNEAAIPGDAALQILKAARGGLRVVVVGDAPRRAPGLNDAARQDAVVATAMAALLKLGTVARVETIGQVAAALHMLGGEPDASFEQSAVLPVHRVTERGDDIWWLLNPTDKTVSVSGTFHTSGVPYRLDLWNGREERAAQWERSRGAVSIPLALPPHTSTALMFRQQAEPLHVVALSGGESVVNERQLEIRDTVGGAHTVRLSDDRSFTLMLASVAAPQTLGPWHLDVDEFSPAGHTPHALELATLADWRSVPGLESVVGSGRYTTQVELSADSLRGDREVLLDLGNFHGAVQVFVNGALVSRQTTPGGRWPVERLLHKGRNDIAVTLDTTLLNRMAQLSASNAKGYHTLAPLESAPSGLQGPVTLTFAAIRAVGKR